MPFCLHGWVPVTLYQTHIFRDLFFPCFLLILMEWLFSRAPSTDWKGFHDCSCGRWSARHMEETIRPVLLIKGNTGESSLHLTRFIADMGTKPEVTKPKEAEALTESRSWSRSRSQSFNFLKPRSWSQSQSRSFAFLKPWSWSQSRSLGDWQLLQRPLFHLINWILNEIQANCADQNGLKVKTV